MEAKEKDQHRHSTGLRDSKVQKKLYRKSDAIKQLEAMANAANQRKFFVSPSEYVSPSMYRDDSKELLTHCIIDFLKIKGCWAERISNNRRNTKTKFHVKSGISAIINGLSVKIQVKYSSSKAQRAYQRQVKQAGGINIVASSFQQFFNWYNWKFGSDES